MSDLPERIREAAAVARAGALADAVERPLFPRVAAQSPFPPTATLDDLVARFRAELEALSGVVHGPFDAEGVARTVVELVHGSGEQGTGNREQILAWSPAELGCAGLSEALARASIELVLGEVPNDGGHHAALERLAALPMGLTGAIAALADTGTIVVASGRGRARVASLLPPVHIAVLPVSRICPTLPDWLADGGAELLKGSANVVAITGPSRTADIELTLTLGMHGPKAIHVVLYAPSPSPHGRGSG